MKVKKLSLIVALVSLTLFFVPLTFACGTCGVTITKEPLYSGYTIEPSGHQCVLGTTYTGWVNSAPTSDLELYTFYEWWVQIQVTNWNSYTITNVRVMDRFGAEFGVDLVAYSGGAGGTMPVLTPQGNSEKIFVDWYIGSLGSGQSATLVLHVWTDHNPADKQEFTSCDAYYMNSGAVVKWLDSNSKQNSAESDPIVLTTF